MCVGGGGTKRRIRKHTHTHTHTRTHTRSHTYTKQTQSKHKSNTKHNAQRTTHNAQSTKYKAQIANHIPTFKRSVPYQSCMILASAPTGPAADGAFGETNEPSSRAWRLVGRAPASLEGSGGSDASGGGLATSVPVGVPLYEPSTYTLPPPPPAQPSSSSPPRSPPPSSV